MVNTLFIFIGCILESGPRTHVRPVLKETNLFIHELESEVWSPDSRIDPNLVG